MAPVPSSAVAGESAPPKGNDSVKSLVSRLYEDTASRVPLPRLPLRPGSDSTKGPISVRYASRSAVDDPRYRGSPASGTPQVAARGPSQKLSPSSSRATETPLFENNPGLRGCSTQIENDSGLTWKENVRDPCIEQRGPRLSAVDCLKKESERVSPLFDRSSVSLSSPGWEQMQSEVELLRKAVQDMHKVTKKQNKRIEELSGQLKSSAQLLKDREVEITALKERCSKSENVVRIVEASIQCQICMDMPLRPFALSPCGHVLCVTCLQEWFKTAPGGPDEAEEDNEDDTIARQKTCPCCRTPVRHRPSPVFMVKAVAAALVKAKQFGTSAPSEDLDQGEDPWKGIFPASDDESDRGDVIHASSDDEHENEDDVDSWMLALGRHRSSRVFWSDESDHEEDLDDFSGRYADYDDSSSEAMSEPASATLVLPHWEPASIRINPDDYDLEDLDREDRESVLSLLRRGCSWEMIQNFDVRYSHAGGIIVSLNSIEDLYSSDNEDSGGQEESTVHHVYLGWNISLDSEDEDGERYMHSVLFDIRNRPQRWRVHPKPDGSVEVRRLVAPNEAEGYSTTDSEIWLDSDGDSDGDGVDSD